MSVMTDLELARAWIKDWLAMPGVVPSHATAREEALAILLAHRALDEAKWWMNELSEDLQGLDCFCERIEALEQAAGGSAAGSQK